MKKVYSLLGWFFGILFILASIGAASNSQFLSLLFFLSIAALLLPPMADLLNRYTKNKLTGGVRVVLVLGIFFLFGLSTSGDDTLNSNYKNRQWVKKGMSLVRAKLKDPSSAIFRNVYFHRGVDNLPITCGEVNSKNSFGAYGGFQKFISGGLEEVTFLQEQASGDFSITWNRFCQ